MVKNISSETIISLKDMSDEFLYTIYPPGVFDDGMSIGIVHRDFGCLELTVKEAEDLKNILTMAIEKAENFGVKT